MTALLSPSRATNAIVDVNLVTDFAGVLRDWNEWYSLQPAQNTYRLTIPAGTYTFDVSGDTLALSNTHAIIRGGTTNYADTVVNFGTWAALGQPGGNSGYASENPQPRFNTVSAGSTSITLIDPADATLFPINSWAIIMGVATQDAGYPANNHFCEFRKIITRDAGTGVLTFEAPLVHSYQSDWPDFPTTAVSFQPDRGGAATAIPMNLTDMSSHGYPWPYNAGHAAFDQILEVRYMTLNGIPNPFDDQNGSCRIVLIEDCYFPATSPVPSACKSWTMRRCLIPNEQTEVDKQIEYLEIDDCTMRNIQIQSAIERLVVTDTDVTPFGCGAVRSTSCTNCTFPEFTAYPTGFGAAEDLELVDCDITTWQTGSSASLVAQAFTDSEATLEAGGVLRFTRNNWQNFNFGILMGHLVPGATMMIRHPTVAGITLGAFRVISIACDGSTITGDILVTTTLPDPYPIWAAYPGMRIHQFGPRLTISGCTGSRQMRSLSRGHPAGARLLSYSDSGIYDGTDGLGSPPNDDVPTSDGSPIHGFVQSITIDVSQAYTGAQPLQQLRIGKFNNDCNLVYADGTNVLFSPTIDLTQVGTRVITPGSTTGTQAGDTGLSMTAGNPWLTNSDPDLYFRLNSGARGNFNADSAGQRANVRMIIEVDPALD